MKKLTAKEKILDLINSGEVTGNRLPGERELAELFQVGRNTIRAALAELEAEGWIERFRKKGTLIHRRSELPDRGLAGMILRTSGHLFEDRLHYLLTEFISAGYSVQSISISPIVGNQYKPSCSIDAAIAKLLKADPKILIVDGYTHSRIPHVDEIHKRHPILLDFYDSASQFPATGIFVDYRKAGYLAGKYLTDRGCRRPVFFPDFVPPKVRFNPDSYGHHRNKMLIEGFRQAVTEAGLDAETAVIDGSSANLAAHKQLLYLLSSNVRIYLDGFCGGSDHLTVEFMKNLLENRGEIPKDIVLAGIGNTPWSQDSAIFPFTSVDLNLEEMAKMAIRQAELPPEQRQNVFIEPKLIIREHKTKGHKNEKANRTEDPSSRQ